MQAAEQGCEHAGPSLANCWHWDRAGLARWETQSCPWLIVAICLLSALGLGSPGSGTHATFNLWPHIKQPQICSTLYEKLLQIAGMCGILQFMIRIY